MTALPSDREKNEIADGIRAFVMLRLEATMDGVPKWPGGAWGNAVDSFGIELTHFGDLVTGFRRSPDGESRQDGWVYAVLEPGTYYLTLSPPAALPFRDPPGLEPEPPIFRLEVPVEAGAVYVGTLKANVLSGPGLFGRIPAGFEAGGVNVVDQTAEAANVIRTHLPDWGDPVTSLLQRHAGGTRTIRTPANPR